jgi:hypothetical protein
MPEHDSSLLRSKRKAAEVAHRHLTAAPRFPAGDFDQGTLTPPRLKEFVGPIGYFDFQIGRVSSCLCVIAKSDFASMLVVALELPRFEN